jgi:hypothetical protein
MSFATLTDATSTSAPARDSGFRTWHFYILLSMVGATVAVMLSRETHPAALLLISAAVVSAGIVGVALHHALAGFLGRADDEPTVLSASTVAALEREKALTLRSIKELEFDHQMGKVSDADFADLNARLRARAMALIADLERAAEAEAERAVRHQAPGIRHQARNDTASCAACGTTNDVDARFCKQCGARLAS